MTLASGNNGVDPDSTVYLKPNDGMLVEGITGSGKTWRLAYQRRRDAPGPLLVTTAKVDLISATHEQRSSLGEIGIFDPEDITGLPNRVQWSILAGCQDPDVTILRAGPGVGMSMGDTKNGDYWEDKAVVLLRCDLHAAAVVGATLSTVRVWVNSRKGSAPERSSPARCRTGKANSVRSSTPDRTPPTT